MDDSKVLEIFYSWWRPTLAWVGVLGVAIQFVVIPTVRIFGVNVQCSEVTPITTLIVAMLGMGGLRTFEKWSDIHNEH